MEGSVGPPHMSHGPAGGADASKVAWTPNVQDHLFTLEKEMGLGDDSTVVYILYNGGDSWYASSR